MSDCCPYHDEFAPTTDQVRSVYALGQGDHSEAVAWRIDCFDRWLAAHTAEAEQRGAEKAWEEGHVCGYSDAQDAARGLVREPHNPYRADEIKQARERQEGGM